MGYRRRQWVEDGLLVEDRSVRKHYKRLVRDSWNAAILARVAFKEADLVRTDKWAKQAALIATKALIYSRGFKPTYEMDFSESRQYCYDTFSIWGDEAFTRASIIGEFLPISEEMAEDKMSLFARTPRGAAEIVTMVESRISIENSPPRPINPHCPPITRYF